MSPDDDDDYGLVCDCLYDGLHDLDGYDRNGVLGADGQVYTDADPGL